MGNQSFTQTKSQAEVTFLSCYRQAIDRDLTMLSDDAVEGGACLARNNLFTLVLRHQYYTDRETRS